jgi:RHS repeat-associated protein
MNSNPHYSAPRRPNRATRVLSKRFLFKRQLLLLCSWLVLPALAIEVGTLSIGTSGSNVQIQWNGSGAVLQSTTNLVGPWNSLSNASSPYLVPPAGAAAFYRLAGSQDESLYLAPQYTSSIGNPSSSCGCTSPENPNSVATPGNPQDNAMGNVYLQTGELVQNAVDLSIPGVGFDWRFERHYRSGMTYNGPLGQGWDFTHNRRLVLQPDGDVKRVGGDGRTDLYVLQTNGTWQSPSGFYTQLTQNTNGVFVERDRHGTRTLFQPPDSFGVARMMQIIDRNSNTMTFSYNSGQLTNVTDTLGRSISYQYNANGELTNVTDFTGRTVKFSYGPNGDLIEVTGPAVTGTPNGNDFPSGKSTLYTYSATHQLLTVTAPNEAAVAGPSRLVAQYDPLSARLTSLRLGGTNSTGIPAGGSITYAYNTLAVAPPGDVTTAVFQTLATNRNGNVTRYQFNQLGSVLNMAQFTHFVRGGDPAGYTNTFTYNADGETTTHTYPNLNFIQFTFDSSNLSRYAQGNLLQSLRAPGPLGGDETMIITSNSFESNFQFIATSTDARGNVTSNSYDANGNCIHITGRIPSIVWDFTYNTAGQMTSQQLPGNGSGSRRLDKSVYYTTGPLTGYLRDRIVDFGGFNITNHFDPDAVGNVTNAVDGRGNNTIFIFNPLNQVVRTLSRSVTTSSGPVRYQTDTFYDADDNVTNTAVQNNDDSGSIVPTLPTINTISAYDILNDRVRETQTQDPTHLVIRTNAYDADQNLVLAANGEAVNGDQPHNVVQTIYDERDLLFRVARAPTDLARSTTQYNYDGNGNLTATIQGVEDSINPRTTTTIYDGFDRWTSRLDPMGNVTTNHYDANGNATNETILGELVDVAGSVGNTNLSSTISTYDGMDRLIARDKAYFDSLTHNIIGSGHSITSAVYSDNSQVLTNFDANTNATAMSYDTANRLSIATDAKGNLITSFYDANNNVTSIQEEDLSDSGQPPQSFTTTFTYDAVDRLIETVYNDSNTDFSSYDSRNNRLSYINRNNNLQRFTYDGLSRRLSTFLYQVPTNNNAVFLQQTWDADSRLISQSDGNSNKTTYIYDALNRQIATVYADGTSSTNTYDVHNNPVSVKDQNGTVVTSSYDLLNRSTMRTVTPASGVGGPTLESYQYDGLSRYVRATNSNSQVTRRYDSLSDLTQEILQALPGGPIGTNTSSYDPAGNQLTCIYPGGRTVSTTFDALNRELAIFSGGLLVSNQYIGKWRLENRFYGNGIVQSNSYDTTRRVTSIQYDRSTDHFLIDVLAYTYDGDGNKQSFTGQNENFLYEYDALDRMSNAIDVIASHTTGYQLDNANNRVQVTGFGGGTYVENSGADSQMNRYSVTPFGTNHYDHNGNLTSSTNQSMSYDYRNQLVSFGAPSGTAAFKFDPFHRRIQALSASGTINFFYNNSYVIQENTSTGATNTYVSGGGSTSTYPFSGFGQTIFMSLSNQQYFVANDDQGSAKVAMDVAGNIAESYHYDPFGIPSFFNGSGGPISASLIGNKYLYGGHPLDPTTGLYYSPARFYSPTLGRFITPDPIGYCGDVRNLGNSYAYAGNNPISLTDPSGLTIYNPVKNLFAWNPYANNLYSYNPYANNLYSWNPSARNLYAFNPYADNLYYGPWGIFGAFRQIAGTAYGFEPLQAGSLFMYQPTPYANWLYPQMPRYQAIGIQYLGKSPLPIPFPAQSPSCGCSGQNMFLNPFVGAYSDPPVPINVFFCSEPSRVVDDWRIGGPVWMCSGNCYGGQRHCAIQWSKDGGRMWERVAHPDDYQDWWTTEVRGAQYRCACFGKGPHPHFGW